MFVFTPLPPEGNEEEDLEDDVREKLTDEEGEIRSYLLHGEPLSEETIEKYASQFWNSEPYKLVRSSLCTRTSSTIFLSPPGQLDLSWRGSLPPEMS